MELPEITNGIIYCRVSSAEQIDGTSLESQEKVCHEYALRENIHVLAVFIEKGESAKTANRTEFIKAISFCGEKKNKVSSFIVYKLDRFARNQEDHISVRSTLRKYNTELRSVTEPIGNNPMGKMMEGILSTFAEFDNNIRTERSVNGMRERLKQGIWVWKCPLGYLRLSQGANISHDPKLASYVQLAFTEYAKGIHTFKSLATFLNDRGFITLLGHVATPSLIEKMIKNPLYAGIIRKWDMEIKGAFEPLIPEDLFYECNGSRKRQNIARITLNPNFPLRKLVICESCTSPITGSASTGRQGVKYPYYHHHRQTCERAKFVPKEDFEDVFVEYLREITPSKEFEILFKSVVMDIWKNSYKKFDDENTQIRKEIATLEINRQRVFDLHQSHVYSDEDFTIQKHLITQKIQHKKLLMHEVDRQEFNMDEALEHAFHFIRNTGTTWTELTDRPESRLCFQKLIFTGNIRYSGKKFGTDDLSLVYKLNRDIGCDNSQLVSLDGLEWNSFEIGRASCRERVCYPV